MGIGGLTCLVRRGGGARRREPFLGSLPRHAAVRVAGVPAGPCKNTTKTTAPPARLLPGELNIN